MLPVRVSVLAVGVLRYACLTAVKLSSEAVPTVAVSERENYWKALIRSEEKCIETANKVKRLSKCRSSILFRVWCMWGRWVRFLEDGNLSNQRLPCSWQFPAPTLRYCFNFAANARSLSTRCIPYTIHLWENPPTLICT